MSRYENVRNWKMFNCIRNGRRKILVQYSTGRGSINNLQWQAFSGKRPKVIKEFKHQSNTRKYTFCL